MGAVPDSLQRGIELGHRHREAEQVVRVDPIPQLGEPLALYLGLPPSVTTEGSHHHFRHPTKPGTITVPHPKKDLKKGLVQAIRKQAGLK
ncbi:type II toxin-antitoxin system HicA family toxin [Halomonas salifodinae]|uniref:Type II toxin-antitoxin system HicA family toxin n=1 Tax=Halomonas salifodinae TaxID=438745 RepID=A0ABW2F1K2_9GAMM